MCGRYSQTQNRDKITFFFELGSAVEVTPRYNIAPSQNAPVMVNEDGTRVLDLYRWGLIPFWAKDVKIGYKMINARYETVGENPAYRRLVNKRRYLVPADGFYGKNQKTKRRRRQCGS